MSDKTLFKTLFDATTNRPVLMAAKIALYEELQSSPVFRQKEAELLAHLKADHHIEAYLSLKADHHIEAYLRQKAAGISPAQFIEDQSKTGRVELP